MDVIRLADAGYRKLNEYLTIKYFDMEINKLRYLEESEIKVKNLLSDIYESESNVLIESKNIRNKSINRKENLDREYNTLINKQKELEEKFDKLRKADDSKWEKAKTEFELAMQFVEGDKESFINKAEKKVRNLSARISELESRIADTTEDIRNSLQQRMDDLEISREEIQNRIDEIKKDSSEKWREIKLWFLAKASSLEDKIRDMKL